MATSPEDSSDQLRHLTLSESTVALIRDQELGRGAYGVVFKARYRGSVCAAKEIHSILIEAARYTPAERRRLQDNFIRECDHCSKLNHPNIVRFIGMYHPPQQLFPVMIMELMDESLTTYAEKPNISFKRRMSILHDVAEGLRYLHCRNPPVIHRDLSPNNVLLKHLPLLPVAKIADLGVAKVINVEDTASKQYLTKAPGTVHFMPPEAFEDNPQYDTSLDVFSYGGITLYTVNGKWPKPTALTKYDPVTRQVQGFNEVQRRQEHLDKITEEAEVLRPLVEACLHNDPVKRPSILELSEKIKPLKITSLTNQLQEMSVKAEELMKKNNTLEEENMQIKSEMLAKITSLTNQLQEMSVKTDEIMQKNSTLEEENMQIKSELLEKQQQVVLNHEDNSTRTVNIEWKEGAAAPASRVLHTAVLLNGLVYVGGCYHDTKEQILHRIDIYDVSFNSWSNSPIFTPYRYFAMTTLNNRLIIAGGRDYHNKTTDMILTFENGAKKLKEYATMTTAKCNVTAAGHLGMLIIAGGINGDGGGLASTEVLDSATGQWHICNALPEPCSWQQSVILSNHLYLVGGYGPDSHASSIVFSSSLDSLSTYQLNWKSYHNLPWWLPAAADLNGTDLIILGGLKKPNDVPVRTSNIYMLNSDTDSHSWEIIGHIPSKRGAPAAVAVGNNKIIVIGGRSFNGRHTNTVWIGLCEAQEP